MKSALHINLAWHFSNLQVLQVNVAHIFRVNSVKASFVETGMSRPAPVGPRVPKDEFMRALGLDHNNPHHEGYYRAMRVGRAKDRSKHKESDPSSKDEAIAVYNRMNQDRSNLIEERARDPATRPPFFWHHIQPNRRREAIIETWQRAAGGTVARRLFDLGATSGEYAPNWVTLWLLYSVFRSRDFRNNRNRRNGDDKGPGGCGEQGKHQLGSFKD